MPRNVRKRTKRRIKATVNIGRPKGTISDIIPVWKQEYMFTVWFDNPVLKHVAKVCSVATGTVTKYKDKNGWDNRAAMIRQRIESQVDMTLEDAKLDAVRELTLLRMKAKDEALSKGFKTAHEATKAFLELLKKELQLRGDKSDVKSQILIIASERFQARKKSLTDKADEAVEPESVEIEDVD